MSHTCEMCHRQPEEVGEAESVFSGTIRHGSFTVHLHAIVEGKYGVTPPLPAHICFKCFAKILEVTSQLELRPA
jgi:hypothetical protein